MRGALTEQRDGAGATDPWLPLLVGVVSLTRGLDRWLELPAAANRAGDAGPEDDPAAAALLGILSLRKRFLAHLDAIAPPRSPRLSHTRAPSRNRSLLR